MQQLAKLKAAACHLQQTTCVTKINDWTRTAVAVATSTDCQQQTSTSFPFTTRPTNRGTATYNSSCNIVSENSKWTNYSKRISRLYDKHKYLDFLSAAGVNSTGQSFPISIPNITKHSTNPPRKNVFQSNVTHCQRQRRLLNFDILKRMLTTSSVVSFNSVDDSQVPSLTEMKRHLGTEGMEFEMGHACLVGECPFCGHKDKQRMSKYVKKMFVNMTTGHCVCQCAEICGSWENLHNSMAIAKQQSITDPSSFINPTAATIDEDEVKGQMSAMEKVNELWENAVELPKCREYMVDRLKASLGIEQITTKTLEKFNIRYIHDQRAFVLPLYGFNDLLQGVKLLEVKKVEEGHEVIQTLYTRHVQTGLFGFHLIGHRDAEIVLVSNVLDALAVYQTTGQTVLALPNGSASLPQETLPLLEQLNQITLWFGNDMRSWEAAKQFARKLNTKRCHFIRPLDGHPPALVALQQGLSLGSILKQASPISHKAIVSFRSLREEVLGELSHAEQVAGVKWKRFPLLNKMLKGHRRGELSVFTGPTGSGKTTFMAEYSLDLCTQGVNTLWGSFEIQNIRLAKVMLTQFAQLNLEKNIEKFDKWADKFERLPLFFMTFHGQHTLKTVIEAMSHAVYVHDIEHIVIDNLQFMVGYSEKQFMMERFAMYDNIIAAFRKFATANNCHVTVVIHPRKENASEELQTASIFGSAKASQEADNVLILQDQRLTALRGRKYIQVVKNRFDGDLGIMPLHFNKESLTMSAPSKLRSRKTAGGKTSKPGEAGQSDESYELFEEFVLDSRQEDELGRGE
ncbi:twinkle protein, mitochondrial-like [Asterias rubens]|uniref:twinkle protein, mitochondrial-like n=1 Tax=Asterias rubens TaxID=7604 RepID=UPI001454E575|nr:twinkle protein, mitochondrial-like [Asterias rubens]XP_033646065.1 twinkle protein, mitochondrial-like [Asterias rubens]